MNRANAKTQALDRVDRATNDSLTATFSQTTPMPSEPTDSSRPDYLELAKQREVPLLDHLKIEPVSASDGRAEFELTVERIHLRTMGLLHGGTTSVLMDTAVGFAAITVAPPGHHVVTVQLNINFTLTAKEGDTLRAAAEVVHGGRKTAVVRGDIHNGNGELVATATATMMYLPVPE